MTSPRSNYTGRKLGNVRVDNKTSIFPPLAKTLSDSNKTFFQEHRLMIHGDALSTPSKASVKEEAISPRSVTSSRPLTSRSDPSSRAHEEMKDLHTRDKQHRSRIQSLQKVIDQLKAELKGKGEELAEVRTRLLQIEEHYKHLYEEEKQAHGKTKEELSTTRDEFREKTIYAEQLKTQHDRQLVDIKSMHEQNMSSLRAEKDKEIREREARIEKMKKQMADILRDNSWERQQQLEELSKELSKVSDEASELKIKYKNAVTSKSQSCPNCSIVKAELERKTKKLSERELTVQQLDTICKKFETQLKQQDILLKDFAVSKGYKPDFDPRQ